MQQVRELNNANDNLNQMVMNDNSAGQIPVQNFGGGSGGGDIGLDHRYNERERKKMENLASLVSQ